MGSRIFKCKEPMLFCLCARRGFPVQRAAYACPKAGGTADQSGLGGKGRRIARRDGRLGIGNLPVFVSFLCQRLVYKLEDTLCCP